MTEIENDSNNDFVGVWVGIALAITVCLGIFVYFIYKQFFTKYISPEK